MKKVLLGLLVLGAMASCKKDKNNSSCESTVAGIAASYKLTKVIAVIPNFPDQDLTTTYTSDCERNGVYQLKSDKTFTYTESGSCSDSGAGTWDIVDNKMTITSTSGGAVEYSSTPITSWDCTTFVLSEDGGGVTYKIYFTKQ